MKAVAIKKGQSREKVAGFQSGRAQAEAASKAAKKGEGHVACRDRRVPGKGL